MAQVFEGNGTSQASVLPQGGGPRRDPRDVHPFLKLASLLEGQAPGRSPAPDGAVINLAIGDPQRPAPPMLAEEIAKAPGNWSRYPPFRGTPDYLAACHDWLQRRYGLPQGLLEPERQILPLPGSREGLFFATLAALSLGASQGRRLILLPEPAYHVYSGAALAAGAEPYFLPVTREGGFLPDYASLPPEVLAKAAIAFLCAPSNPEGAACSKAEWSRQIKAARHHGYFLAADECYADIYNGDPPDGALQAAADLGACEGLVTFHSLSKRSSAAGLRCGFAAGDQRLIDALDAFLRFGGAGTPVPVLKAGAALWRDDAHAAENRAFYQDLFQRSERLLQGRFGWEMPKGGFFLWLEVGDSEAAALKLWREGGLRVLPGAYMCPRGADDCEGRRYIRVALVFEPEVSEPALERLITLLDQGL